LVDEFAGVYEDGFSPMKEVGVPSMPKDVGFLSDGSSTSHSGLHQNRVDVSVLAGLLVFTYVLVKATNSGPNVGCYGAIWKLGGDAVYSSLLERGW